MPFMMEWLVEGHLLYQTYWGNQEIEDTKAAMDCILTYLNQAEHPLMHTLMDVSKVNYFSNNVMALRDATREVYQHPKLGWIIMFGRKDALLDFVVNIVTQIFRAKVKLFSTKEEGIHFLCNVDSELKKKLEP